MSQESKRGGGLWAFCIFAARAPWPLPVDLDDPNPPRYDQGGARAPPPSRSGASAAEIRRCAWFQRQPGTAEAYVLQRPEQVPDLPGVEGFRHYLARHAEGQKIFHVGVTDREIVRNR
jgi:hypothetical protein